ncbi:hypothetical protein [Halalkalicoccus ordinarius]|uniref:hypothetical protein n=1 Tax=Halalkalicoccus ordinarius TaxID=3116651 RepID=UPI00300F5659
MPNTRIEAVLQAIGDGAQLEQLASDLLQREGYNVNPTGTRGPDNKRDALLSRNDEQGILHCSISQDLENKLRNDAQKAASRNDSYDIFIFATTQNPSGSKRDRLEDEISDEYGWRVQILDLQRLRNKLQGNPDNHDLIRDHLRINPNRAFEDPEEDAQEFYQSRIEELQAYNGYYGSIEPEDDLTGREERPILTVHMIPAEAFGSDHDRLGSELPDPPGFRRSGYTQQYGDFVITGDNNGLNGENPFTSYACFHEDGWAEVVTVDILPQTDNPELTTMIDKYVVDFVEDALDWYAEVGINPPFYTYLTVLNAAEYTIYVPKPIWGPHNRREIGDDVFRFGEIRIDRYDTDVPTILQQPLYRLWMRTGWPGSLHYNEIKENGEIRYEWDPRD